MQHFLVIRHLMAGIAHHRAVGDIRDMRTGRGAGIGFFFEVGVEPGKVVIHEGFALEVGNQDFLELFAARGVNNMLIERAVLRVFFGVAEFPVEPGRHGAVDNRTADFAVDIADNQFIVADEDGFFAEIGFEETGALDDAWFIFILLVDFHLDAGALQANFRRAEGVFAQPFNAFGIAGLEELLPAADISGGFVVESYRHVISPLMLMNGAGKTFRAILDI